MQKFFLKRGQDGMLKKSEISVILYNYHWMIQTIALKRSELGDAGERITAQYGIKASLPKPKGVHSDPIYFEVERRQKVHDNLRKIENKVMFIQENMHVIKNESEKIVLNKLLDG